MNKIYLNIFAGLLILLAFISILIGLWFVLSSEVFVFNWASLLCQSFSIYCTYMLAVSLSFMEDFGEDEQLAPWE